jgi:hypothetical protein
MRKGEWMAKELNEKETASQEELLMSHVLSLDALMRLLMKKGIIKESEFFLELQKIEQEYEKKKQIDR